MREDIIVERVYTRVYELNPILPSNARMANARMQMSDSFPLSSKGSIHTGILCAAVPKFAC
jgi:hypothetical protein